MQHHVRHAHNFARVAIVLALVAILLVLAGATKSNASTRFPVFPQLTVSVIYNLTKSGDWRKSFEQAITQINHAGKYSDIRLIPMASSNVGYTAEYNCSKKNPCIIVTGHHAGIGKAARSADDIISGRPYKRHGYLNYSRGTEVGLTPYAHKRKTSLGMIMVLLGESNHYGTSHSVTNLGIFGQSNLATVDWKFLDRWYSRDESGGGGGSW